MGELVAAHWIKNDYKVRAFVSEGGVIHDCGFHVLKGRTVDDTDWSWLVSQLIRTGIGRLVVGLQLQYLTWSYLTEGNVVVGRDYDSNIRVILANGA